MNLGFEPLTQDFVISSIRRESCLKPIRGHSHSIEVARSSKGSEPAAPSREPLWGLHGMGTAP